MAELTIRPGHPDFLDLPWDEPLATWSTSRVVELPRGISRHEVRFVAYDDGIYAVKELPERAARRDYEILRYLEEVDGPAVRAVGLVTRRDPDPTVEQSAALITRYLDHSFSYRELLEGAGFGERRTQMLDAFASLLVELHLAGCFWGDCSLSNTLYRWDADAIETRMVDAETAEIYDELTDGQRAYDLDIMIENVAGGMADIAAEHGIAAENADLQLGEDIAGRYRSLWDELAAVWVVGPDERYKIEERVERLNELGFDVEEVVVSSRRERLELRVKVGGRDFHRRRLRELTGVEAGEGQARQILADLYYFQANRAPGVPSHLAAVRWRIEAFEPMLARLTAIPEVDDPVQAYCDLLRHRYLLSVEAHQDVGTETAFDDWLAAGRPGYPPGGTIA